MLSYLWNRDQGQVAEENEEPVIDAVPVEENLVEAEVFNQREYIPFSVYRRLRSQIDDLNETCEKNYENFRKHIRFKDNIIEKIEDKLSTFKNGKKYVPYSVYQKLRDEIERLKKIVGEGPHLINEPEPQPEPEQGQDQLARLGILPLSDTEPLNDDQLIVAVGEFIRRHGSFGVKSIVSGMHKEHPNRPGINAKSIREALLRIGINNGNIDENGNKIINEAEERLIREAERRSNSMGGGKKTHKKTKKSRKKTKKSRKKTKKSRKKSQRRKS